MLSFHVQVRVVSGRLGRRGDDDDDEGEGESDEDSDGEDGSGMGGGGGGGGNVGNMVGGGVTNRNMGGIGEILLPSFQCFVLYRVYID